MINILIYLLGKDATLSTSLTSINSRFGLSNLANKIILIINDMSHYKDNEPKKLKELITSDQMETEKKV